MIHAVIIAAAPSECAEEMENELASPLSVSTALTQGDDFRKKRLSAS